MIMYSTNTQIEINWDNFLSFFFSRFYFKKLSDEFDCGVVFEEVREDHTVLPIFEEKIIGKVEKIDWVRIKTYSVRFWWNEREVGWEKVFFRVRGAGKWEWDR